LARWRKNENIRIDEQALKETEKGIKKKRHSSQKKKTQKKNKSCSKLYKKGSELKQSVMSFIKNMAPVLKSNQKMTGWLDK